MAARRGAAGALEHELPAHELTVVFAHGARSRLEARIGQIGRAGELPAIAEQAFAAAGQRRRGGVELVPAARIVRLRLPFLPARDRFPFEFGGQPLARPTGEGIGLEIGDMRDRCIRVARLPAGMGEMLALAPVERRSDCVFAHPGPAVGQPQAGGVVAAIGDEGIPFAVGHQPRRQREGFEQNAVRGTFVVEGKPVRLVADARDPAGMFVPLLRLRLGSGCGCVPHRGAQRVLEQAVLDVGEQQFLVLLFVAEAQLDQRRQVLACEQRLHRGIDMRAPGKDFLQRRPRQHPARKAVDAFAFGFVIGIEHERPAFVEQRVPFQPVAQEEGFPEPCGVRQVPLGRAGVFHRLDRRIGIGQRRGERFAERADGIVACVEAFPGGWARTGLQLGHRRSPLGSSHRTLATMIHHGRNPFRFKGRGYKTVSVQSPVAHSRTMPRGRGGSPPAARSGGFRRRRPAGSRVPR